MSLMGTGRMGEFARRMADIAEEQHLRTICGTCGTTWDGSLRNNRDAFRAHVEQEHPELVSMLDVARLRPKRERATERDEYGVLTLLSRVAA